MGEKLPSLKARQLTRFLHQQGFVMVHQKGSHATYKNPLTNRRVTIPIHPGKDLKRGLVHSILNDLGLSTEEFLKQFRS